MNKSGKIKAEETFASNPSPSRPRPTAPAIYKPQPTPKALQTRMAVGNPRPNQFRVNSTQPAARGITYLRTRSVINLPRIKLVQPKLVESRPINSAVGAARAAVTRRIVQRFSSRVVQATRFYPNLHPGAVEPVDPSNIFRLNSFADQYRLHKVHSHGVNVPNQQYNFVRTGEGEMLLHSRYRHPSIAEGKRVLYAGEIFFNNGQLQWWSNGSGHYQPDTDSAEQANLPMESFFSYQQIIKGEHTRK
jgi:hypothetical protein